MMMMMMGVQGDARLNAPGMTLQVTRSQESEM